jgi:hypothetical protein
MTKFGFIRFTVILLFCISSAYGQKVKYKDLFGLLSSKQYEAAEPFLKRYLKDNTDNPNAFLFMGIIFQDKASKNDILKQTPVALANMDSAIIFYDKAYATITEKEVKRNDEYYQAYNRRDLRTGEFGVKLSDIQFDIEKRKEGLRERMDKVKMVKFYFTLSDSLYKKSNLLFRSLQNTYASEKEFYLRANDTLLNVLSALAARADSSVKMFDNYKNSAAIVGKIGYSQVITLKEITNFKKDGTTSANFYDNDLQLWDYKKFALSAKQTIEKEIVPMRKNLITYDVEINKRREKLNHDSVSVRSDLTKLIDQLLMAQLLKFDPDPLPMQIFSLKIADLEYRSAIQEDKVFKDSADVKLHLDLVKKEVNYLNRLDSLLTKLDKADLDEEASNYDYFISNTFSNTTVLKSYIQTLKDFSMHEKDKRLNELHSKTEALKWLVNAQDSIPLFMLSQSKYKSLATVDDKFTAGLVYADSLNASGYFYNIPYSHIPNIKASFPVDKASFRLSKLPNAKALTYTDAAGQIFFVMIYSDKPGKDNKYQATVCKIYKSDGLAWNNNYALAFNPKEITFKAETGELTVKGESLQSIIDKNGKLLK